MNSTRHSVRNLTLLFLLATVILAANALLPLYLAGRLAVGHAQVADSLAVQDTLDKMLATVLAAESGARGFLLTGDENYLEPYLASRKKVDSAIDKLQQLTASDPAQQQHLHRIKMLATEKLDYMQRLIAVYRAEALAAARGHLRTNIGKQAMDTLHAAITEMEDEEERAMAERLARVEQADRNTLIGFLGLSALDIALFAAVFMLAVRHNAARRRSEEENERLVAIVETSGDAIVSSTVDGALLSWNAGAEKMFGYTAAEMAGRNISFIAPPDRQYESQHHAWLMQNGKSVRPFETIRIAKDGHPVHVQISISGIRDTGGNVTRMGAIFRDIEERKQAEVERARLAAIVESSQDAIIGRALDGTIQDWNASAERLYGYTAAEAIGQNIEMIMPSDSHDQIVRNNERMRRGQTISPFEMALRTKHGQYLEASCSISAIKNAAGEIVGASIINHDITERKQAEEARARLAAIVESAKDAIISRTLEGTITSWNAAAERILGYTAPEAIGHNLTLTPSDRHHETAESRGLLRAGKPVLNYETVRVAKDGHGIDVSLSASPIKDASGNVIGTATILRDVTERKQIEDTLRASEAQLRLVTDNVPAMIAYHDAGWRCRYANRQYCEFYGVDPQAAIGMHQSELLGEEGYALALPNLHRFMRGESVSYQRLHTARDGTRREIAVVGVPDRTGTGSGEVRGFYVLIQDITERKRAAETRAQLAAIVESANDAIISRTLEGTITSWNAAAERLFGYTAAEAVGQPINIFVPPDHHSDVERTSKLLLGGGRMAPTEVVRLTKEGQPIDVMLGISPIKSEAGEVIGAAIIVSDISERKRAERELQRKAELAQLLESLARAANEAATPEAALQVCIARICKHGRWIVGHVGHLAPGAGAITLTGTQWHIPDHRGFEEFVALSDSIAYRTGGFISTALAARKPHWIADFSAAEGLRRQACARKLGIRAGFAFPVIVHDEVAAYLEFFADEVREPDPGLLEAIPGIASQLARLIERKRALDEVRANEQKLDSILGALNEIVWSMDPRSGRLIYLNAAAKKLARRPVNDLLANARLWRKMIHREDRAAVRGSVRKLMEDGKLTHEFRLVLTDSEVRTVENRAHVVRDAEGKVQRIDGTITDITEHKQAAERIDYLTQYDVVTGLPNRRRFDDRLTLALARDKRVGMMTALLLLDLDRFKQINESLGHSAGDKVLQAVAARLKERLREVDTIARLDSEFAVILESVTDKAQAYCVAEKIVEAMGEPFVIDAEEIFVTASVGVAVYPADADSVEKLIKNAELAMHRAKREGGNAMQPYVPDQNPRRGASIGMENKLRRALEHDEFLLHFQPKVNIKTGAITGAEALVRWRNPDLGLVSPADFIPLAEETGLIVPIGEWVLHSACTQASAWRSQGHALAMAVNLSARQFRQKNLREMIEQTLADSGLDAGHLELEITESMTMHRPEQAIATLQQLRDFGITLSVDDFGTGYSSLSYLKRFPVHNLKVDQSFVRELHINADDAAIVRAVIALAQNLNLKTIAEGVETEQQLIFLAGLQCDEYQGYYFSKPLPAADFLSLLQAEHAAHPGVAKIASGDGSQLRCVSAPRRGETCNERRENN